MKYNLTPAQQRIILTEIKYDQPLLSNVGGYYKIHGGVEPKKLRNAILDTLLSDLVFHILFNDDIDGINQSIVGGKNFSESKILVFSSRKDYEIFKKETFDTSLNIFSDDLFKIGFYIGNGEAELLLMFHHSIMDAYSIGLFASQVFSRYNNEVPHVQKLDYLQFVDEEKNYIGSQKFMEDKIYWLNRFRTMESNLQEGVKNTAANKIIKKISSDFEKKLKKFLKENRVNPNIFFITLLTICQYKLKGNNSGVIGVPYYNRKNKDYLNTFGMFVSTVPFIFNISKKDTLEDVYNKTKKNFLKDIKHSKYPFNYLVQDLQIGRKNLFSTSFNYYVNNLNYKVNDTAVDVVEITPSHLSVDKNIIYRSFEDTNDEIEIVYCEEKLSAQDVEFDLYNAKVYLEKLFELQNPMKLNISSSNFLTIEQESRILMKQAENLSKPVSYSNPLIARFQKCVQGNPEKIAIESIDSCLSYSEMADQMDKQTNYYLSKGIKKRDRVAIIAHKEVNTFLSFLVLVNIGAIYIPIDPDFPEERKAFIVKDSNSKYLVDRNVITFNNGFEDHLDLGVTDNRILYILYTSGTTGKPKGIEIPMDGITRLIEFDREYELSKIDCFLQLNSLSFDISQLEVWGALCMGNTLKIVSKDLLMNPDELSKALRRDKRSFGTIMSVTILRELFKSNKEIFRNAKFIITGGELVDSALVSDLYAEYSELQVINGYGPTENSVLSTAYSVPRDIHKNQLIPIGDALPGSSIYILDNQNQLCTEGQLGEIVVGGKGVGNGYLNRAELNKQKFIDLWFLNQEIGYRTGDFGYYGEQQNIYVVGRKDDQVKINGQRIELQEIQNVLNGCFPDSFFIPKVIDDKLVCFHDYLLLNEEAILCDLKQELPQIMLPKQFICVKSWPYTINGKLDEKQLNKIYLDKNVSYTKSLVNPITINKELLTIFRNVLKHNKIDFRKSFLANGGDSLSAMKVNNELKKHSFSKIPVNQLLDDNSLITIFDTVEKIQMQAEVGVCQSCKKTTIASPFQKGIYLDDLLKHEKFKYNSPIIVLIDHINDLERLKEKIEKYLNSVKVLNSFFFISEMGLELKTKSKKHKVNEVCSNVSNIEYLIKQNLTDFSLENSLFKATLINYSDTKHCLLFDFHHSIIDGASKEIFLKGLEAFLNGDVITHSHDYFEYLQNNEECDYRVEKEFWTEKCKNFQLDFSHLISNNEQTFSKSRFVKINESKIDILYTIAKKNQVTPNVVMMGLLMAVQSFLSDNPTAMFGTTTSTRNDSLFAETFGPMINTIPIIFEIDLNQDFSSFIQSFNKEWLGYLENSSYPLSEIDNLYKQVKGIPVSSIIKSMFVWNKEINLSFVTEDKQVFQNYIPKSSVQTKYPISYVVTETEESCYLNIEYDTKSYSDEFIKSLIKLLENMLTPLLKDNTLTIVEAINIMKEK